MQTSPDPLLPEEAVSLPLPHGEHKQSSPVQRKKRQQAEQFYARLLHVGSPAKKLEKVAKMSGEVLLRVSAVFPFDLFPDEIVVDKNKISVIHRMFFSSEEIRSIPIDGIADVIVDSGPLFAAVRIVNTRFTHEPLVVQYLKKEDARKVQEVIQGLVLAQQKEIDLSRINRRELISGALTSGAIAV